eukprot:TRINITY_DN8410_c0_g1_i1.p1 TRINITY_DN8410_c0_g1~~TRINITY_DN8410_c0_g1_i1.p1  ORF type:complete len:609 (+),score=142.17 TRINITY_DN8410_c0_g1_i1:91-1917(+)
MLRSHLTFASSFLHLQRSTFQPVRYKSHLLRAIPSSPVTLHDFRASILDVSSPRLPFQLSPRRNFFTMNALTIKLILGASLPAAYVLYQVVQRRVGKQKQYVLAKLNTPLEFEKLENSIERKEEEILASYFSFPPSGPSVIIGPEGAGKNTLLKKVFRDRKMTFWVDLKQTPVINGEDFMRLFIERTGYMLPTSGDTIWAVLFLAVNRRISNPTQDTDKALAIIAEVLNDEKERGWPNGVPVIVLDDLHRLGTCNDMELRNSKISDDKNFLKFLDWIIHISDRKLAHVVFLTSYTFAHLDLDSHTGFRHRRSLMSLYFSDTEAVKAYLQRVANSETIKTPLSPEAMDTIVRCIGGQVDDIDRVVNALRRGDSYINILRTMLTDSIALVEDHLGRILEEASKATDEPTRMRVFEKYLRFWTMMELLHQEETVNRRLMIVNVFYQNTDELESLLASHMITIVNEQPPDTMSKKPDSIFSLLNSSLDSVAIAAGSPKLRTAFGLLLKDQKMVKQKTWVSLQIELKNLREREKDKLDKRKDLLGEVAQLSGHLEKLVLNEDKWVSSLSLEDFQNRKKILLERETAAESEILEVTKKLAEVRKEISAKTTPVS